MRLTSVILVCLISLSLSACARVVLRPILKTDLVSMPVGQPYTPEKNGWFLSDDYVRKIGVVINK